MSRLLRLSVEGRTASPHVLVCACVSPTNASINYRWKKGKLLISSHLIFHKNSCGGNNRVICVTCTTRRTLVPLQKAHCRRTQKEEHALDAVWRISIAFAVSRAGQRARIGARAPPPPRLLVPAEARGRSGRLTLKIKKCGTVLNSSPPAGIFSFCGISRTSCRETTYAS